MDERGSSDRTWFHFVSLRNGEEREKRTNPFWMRREALSFPNPFDMDRAAESGVTGSAVLLRKRIGKLFSVHQFRALGSRSGGTYFVLRSPSLIVQGPR